MIMTETTDRTRDQVFTSNMNNKLETDNLQITGSFGSYCEEVVICMIMHDYARFRDPL